MATINIKKEVSINLGLSISEAWYLRHALQNSPNLETEEAHDYEKRRALFEALEQTLKTLAVDYTD